MRRVCTDSDTDSNNKIKINEVRAGLIKAFINRKARLNGDKEEITVALNPENKNPAYLCGRLFAVLEKIQLEAADVKLNRTIKDAYFSSASSRPALIMPRLIDLSKFHLSKLSEGRTIYFSKLIDEIMDNIEDNLPANLSLIDKGNFQVGYFHQNSYFFTKKDKNEEPETVNE